MSSAKKFEITRQVLDNGAESITAHAARLMLAEIDALETKLHEMTTLVKTNLAELSELEAKCKALQPPNKVRGKSCTEIDKIDVKIAQTFSTFKNGRFAAFFIEDDCFRESTTFNLDDNNLVEVVVRWLHLRGRVLSDRRLADLREYAMYLHSELYPRGDGYRLDDVMSFDYFVEWLENHK